MAFCEIMAGVIGKAPMTTFCLYNICINFLQLLTKQSNKYVSYGDQAFNELPIEVGS